MARNYDNPADRPIGSTFTASGSTGNTKSYVVANGQTLNKSDYPELAETFASQTFENVGSASYTGGSTGGNFGVAQQNARLVFDSTSTYTVYAQTIYYTGSSSFTGVAIWTTSNGEDWALAYSDTFSGFVNKVCAIGSEVFVCCDNGLLRTTNGTTFTKVMDGKIYDICSNGTTYLIITNGSGILSTTDFLTFTKRTISGAGGTVYGCVFLSPHYLVTFDSSNVVWYSTDLVTWTASSNNMSFTAYQNYVRVVNNTFISIPCIDGSAYYVYSTNPTTGSFTNAGRNYSSGSSGFIMGIYYDSTLSQYIIATARNSSMFGYVVTTLNQSGSTYENGPNVVGTNDSLVYKYGSNCYRSLHYHYTKKTTTWTTGTFAITNNDVIPNPFFQTSQIGWSKVGTTIPGKRYIAKQIGSNGSVIYHTVSVEINGVFKPLINISTDPWLFSSSTTDYPSALLYEDNRGYAYMVSGGTSTYYFATIDPNRNRLSSGNGGTPAGNTSVAIPVKGRGIELHSLASTSTRSVYLISPDFVGTTPSVSYSYNLYTVSTPFHYNVSYATDEILITEINATPTTNPAIYVLKNGALLFRSLITLINSSGSTVSVTSNLKVWKLNGTYFATQSNILYRSSDGAVYNQISYCDASSSNVSFNVEYDDGLAIGSYQTKSTAPGQSTFQIFAISSALSAGPLTGFFKLNNREAVFTVTYSSMSCGVYKTPVDVSTEFIVPSIPSSTSGQTTCIVAR